MSRTQLSIDRDFNRPPANEWAAPVPVKVRRGASRHTPFAERLSARRLTTGRYARSVGRSQDWGFRVD